MRELLIRRVFISHSHQDRHIATELQSTLETYGAETFLDQERIRPADVLPDRIRDGIVSCQNFLLIWSASAARSQWVDREWDMAYQLKKKIVPYVLDGTSLPAGLDNLVYITLKDRELGNVQLLTAIFGPGFKPDPTTLFPGQWQASVDAFGMAQGTYNLELRANGQVEGEGGITQGGLAGQLARQVGMTGLLTMRISVHGRWSYDQGTGVLTLELFASGFGQQTHDTIMVRTTGEESQAIRGEDLAGRTWTLKRVY